MNSLRKKVRKLRSVTPKTDEELKKRCWIWTRNIDTERRKKRAAPTGQWKTWSKSFLDDPIEVPNKDFKCPEIIPGTNDRFEWAGVIKGSKV